MYSPKKRIPFYNSGYLLRNVSEELSWGSLGKLKKGELAKVDITLHQDRISGR